jgi:alcohol dehydrogenase class IV
MSYSGLLDHKDWGFPVPIFYGPGRISHIGSICKNLEIKNPLVVTDRGSWKLPFIQEMRSLLSRDGISSELFFEISPNPIGDEIGAGCNAYRDGKHDSIIGIGGGSGMDGAKAICLTVNNDIDLWAFDYNKPVPQVAGTNPFPKLITIPTTAGTGAETESTAMVTHSEKGMKFCLDHPQLKISAAVLDPVLTVGLPPNLTAWTGVDALTHAIEAYIVPDFHPLCDGAAIEALKLIDKFLVTSVEEPENLEARGGMLVGSCLAGISFLKGLGFVHAISHMVGAEFDTQHGLTNAIVLPVVLRYNLPSLDEKRRQMADALNINDKTTDGFVGEIEATLNRLDIPRSLSSIGVPLDCASRVAEKAMFDSAASTNPVKGNSSDIKALIERSISEARRL